MEPWREWAISHGSEVRTVARKFSGVFVNNLMDAYVHADVLNSEKILDTWPEVFKQLYKIYEAGGRSGEVC